MYEDDISSDLQSIISEKQFVRLSQQVELQSLRRQKLLEAIYHKNHPKPKDKFLRYDASLPIHTPSYNKYEEQYIKWKQSENQASQDIKIDNNKRNLHKYQTQAQLRQLSKGMSAKKMNNAKVQLSNNIRLINQQYKQKLITALKTHHYQLNKVSHRLYQLDQQQALQKKQKIIPNLANSVGIMADPINQQIKQKSYQFDRSNFQSIIKHPPKQKQSIIVQPPQQTKFPEKPPEQQIFLDVQAILKIPHSQFLIFFQHNLRMISRLATSDEMTRLIDYRDEALKKENVLERLRQKISEANPDTIKKLSNEKKEKLFRLLYENK